MNVTTCTLDAQEFRRALEKALKAAPKRSPIPVLTEVHASFTGDACTLTCTNLEQWCQVSVPARGGRCSFVFTDSRKLLAACRYFFGGMELSCQKGQPPESAPSETGLDGVLTLRCGNKELRQRVTAAADFPEPPELEAERVYSVDAASLSKRFERIKYALPADAARPCSRCVKFFDSRIGAVDGHRLALSRDESLRVEAPFYIPPEAMRLLPVLGKTVCRLSVGARHAAFDSGTVRVITRIPEGEGLDFNAVIPGSCLEEQTVDVADFAGSLRYLNEFICNPGHEAVRFDGGVLSVKNARGEYRSRLELSGASQAVIGFDGSYMLDGLKQFQAKGLRAVAMRLNGPTAPVILTDQSDLALILPLRLRRAA